MMDGIDGGMGSGAWLFMSVFLIALVALIVWAVASVVPRDNGRADSGSVAGGPEDILDRRVASGEIDAATYDELRDRLRRGRATDGVVATPGRRAGMLVLAAVLVVLAAGAIFATARTSGTDSNSMRGADYAMMGSEGSPAAWFEAGRTSVNDISSARSRAQAFADRLGMTTGEVMQFTNNFYVQLLDGENRPATEVLVDPRTGTVTLEYGPAMMWNTKYGMMSGSSSGMMEDGGSGGMMGGGSGGMMEDGGSGGMMGGAGSGGMMGGAGAGGMMDGSGMMGRVGGEPSWSPSRAVSSKPVSVSEARRIANAWLSREKTGLDAADPVRFPGYFTMDTLADGRPEGMLSVNESTGAVWYHWWHGRFVAMVE